MDDEAVSRASFANRLRALRRAHGGRIGNPRLSLTAFAELLGIKAERYRRYERGEVEPPLLVLNALGRVTGVSLDRLISGEANRDDRMIPVQGMRDDQEMILGDRIRWVREVGFREAEKAAEKLNVPLDTWKLWEAGATRPPFDKLYELTSRFPGLTVDFMVNGTRNGLNDEWLQLLERWLGPAPHALRSGMGSGPTMSMAPNSYSAAQ